MRRSLLVAVLLAVVLLGGCLRTRIDLCVQVPPHPECAYLDAGRDSPGTDAPNDAPVDASPDGSIDDSGIDAGVD